MKKVIFKRIKTIFPKLFCFLGLIGGLISFVSCKKTENPVYSFFPEKTKRLTLYSSLDSKLTELLACEFEYITGIWVQTYSGNTNQVKEKILSSEDEENGDVLLCCASDAISIFSDFIQPYVKNNSLIQRPFGQKNLAAFAITPVGYLYNVDFFEQTQKVDLYQQLRSNEKLSILNPFYSTENFTCLFYLYSTTLYSDLKAFYKLFDDYTAACDSVAEGFSSAVLLPENQATIFQSNQHSTRTNFFLPPQSNVIINTAAILNNSSSKENGERFIAFLQSKETQNFLTNELKYRPVRRDSDLTPENQKMLNDALGNGKSDAITLNTKKNALLLQWIIKNGGPQK